MSISLTHATLDRAAPADGFELSLESWRRREGLTVAALAQLLEMPSSTVHRLLTGESRPSAEDVETIKRVTGGAVGPWSMHQTRLQWERANARPLRGGAGDSD